MPIGLGYGAIEDAELWKEMRRISNRVTREYHPDRPNFTEADLNKIVRFAPEMIKILDNIKTRIGL